MLKPQAELERFTKPKRIICRNTLFNGYVQPDGSWGAYKTAKRFEDDGRAHAFALQRGLTGYSVMPISKPKVIK